MKLLITGFDPFGGESINPSWEAVKRLPDSIGAWDLTKMQLPTQFGKAAELVIAKAEDISADAVICVGQAGGRAAVTPEFVGINYRHARIPDNAGVQAQEETIVPGGPEGLFSTLPVQKTADAIKAAGLPGAVSYSAGTFVCNDVLYSLLAHFRGTATRCAFIHVPFLPEQAGDKHPSMTLEAIIAALTEGIRAI